MTDTQRCEPPGWDTREDIMRHWDAWRSYIAGGGKASWPRDAFESLLDYYDERLAERTPPSTVAALVEALERLRPLLRMITVRQAIEAGDAAINAVGLNPWAMNEGLAMGDEPIPLGWLDDVLALYRGEVA